MFYLINSAHGKHFLPSIMSRNIKDKKIVSYEITSDFDLKKGDYLCSFVDNETIWQIDKIEKMNEINDHYQTYPKATRYKVYMSISNLQNGISIIRGMLNNSIRSCESLEHLQNLIAEKRGVPAAV